MTKSLIQECEEVNTLSEVGSNMAALKGYMVIVYKVFALKIALKAYSIATAISKDISR